MKKFFVLLMAVVMCLSTVAFASEYEGKTTEELIEIIEGLEAEIAELRGETPEETTEETAEPEPTEVPEYIELTKGSKGQEVVNMQKRLIELGYLTGGADGAYGNGTAGAVSKFQSQHNLSATGTADVDTQKLLFSDEAQQAIVYEKLDYKGCSRDPDDYEGRYVSFSGKVLQIIEYDSFVCFRIASRGSYNDVVFVRMTIPESYSRILEDDKVTVSGTYGGLYSYETVRGDTLTIPMVYASTVTLK